jgi:hypothetical protein
MRQVLQGTLAACVLAAIALCGVWGGSLCPVATEEPPGEAMAPAADDAVSPVQSAEDVLDEQEEIGAPSEAGETDHDTGLQSARG